MTRKPYLISISVPRGTHETTVQLTEAEADVVRFAAEELLKVAAPDGSVDSFEVQEAA